MIRGQRDETPVEQVEGLQFLDQLADQAVDELHLEQIALLVVADRPGLGRPQLPLESVNAVPRDTVGVS